MKNNEKRNDVIEESTTKKEITIHIDSNELLTLKELSEILDIINKTINYINRENGIKSNAKIGKEYAAEITGVDHGSIVINMLVNFVKQISLSVLADCLYERMKKIWSKKEKKTGDGDIKFPIYINVNGSGNLIDINITKPEKERIINNANL